MDSYFVIVDGSLPILMFMYPWLGIGLDLVCVHAIDSCDQVDVI